MASDPSVGPPDQSAEKKQLSKQLSNACRASTVHRRASTVHRLQRPLRPAAELDDPVPASLSVEPPSDSDLSVVVERQLGYTGNVTDYNVFKVGCRCRHGYPQAFAFDPLSRSTPAHHRNPLRRAPVDSGLFRLSCPWLVKAIDEWEAKGAVIELNEAVAQDDELREGLAAAHRGHAAARTELVGDQLEPFIAEDQRRARELLPEVGIEKTLAERRALVERVMQSGIAGQNLKKEDVKCLHAQMADHLCRGRANPIGTLIEHGLEARGVQIDGSDECRFQCESALGETAEESGWLYRPAKNKQRLSKKKEGRKILRDRTQKARAKRAEEGGAEGKAFEPK